MVITRGSSSPKFDTGGKHRKDEDASDRSQVNGSDPSAYIAFEQLTEKFAEIEDILSHALVAIRKEFDHEDE